MNNNETRLEELAKAIEEGNQDLALELAQSLRSGDLEFDEAILVATGFLEGGAPSDALELLQALETAVPPSEISEALEAELQELLKVRLAEALYATGDPEKALETLQPIASRGVQEAADREYFSALCCDHLGDRALADAHFAMATELDPERNPPIPSISIEDAQDIVGQVIGELPEALRDAVEKVPILIEDLPSISWIRETGGEIHPDTLGLYTGVNLMDRSYLGIDSFEKIPTEASIHIFRRNLERISHDPEQLRSEIRITLLHELGHHLGLDEEDVDRLGLS
ncbi:MAG: metallopeptidase family protein [Planctomycetota bacterium]|nr:metallopeptidase family protein [Planctomycetota bacterium]